MRGEIEQRRQKPFFRRETGTGCVLHLKCPALCSQTGQGIPAKFVKETEAHTFICANRLGMYCHAQQKQPIRFESDLLAGCKPTCQTRLVKPVHNCWQPGCTKGCCDHFCCFGAANPRSLPATTDAATSVKGLYGAIAVFWHTACPPGCQQGLHADGALWASVRCCRAAPCGWHAAAVAVAVAPYV